MTLRDRLSGFVKTGEKSLTADIQQAQLFQDVLFALSGHFERKMAVDRDPRILLQHLIAFESLMKRGNEKCAGLHPDTFECLLWLNDKKRQTELLDRFVP